MSDDPKGPLAASCPLCGAPEAHPCVNGRYEDLKLYRYGTAREPHPQRIRQRALDYLIELGEEVGAYEELKK